MRVTAIIMLTLALAACNGPQSRDYVGEPIERAARDLGRPETIRDLPDGTRSFSWEIEQFAQVGPTRIQNTTLTASTSSGVGVGVNLGRDTVSTGTCTYTLFGRRAGDTFVVESVDEAGRSCV
ncbi:hypothetical protein [Pontivivens insulae]|uniref:Uncharacterized protein n=1 Tax=Pontivivens insulae TaxID=1639689 RepID=A0A2R8ACB9_9RHOB|nr:hypothetical protein [Pontivivens insulae]RED13790.1 hypothetical protein DFR53_1132 [Pontivivens insulae]SPF29864.1 hypothetical protein POI8812_02185 [Pontivivens insulae]